MSFGGALPLRLERRAVFRPALGYMDETNKPLRQLQEALEALPPAEFIAWTEWVENRLAERLRQRSAHKPIKPEDEETSDG